MNISHISRYLIRSILQRERGGRNSRLDKTSRKMLDWWRLVQFVCSSIELFGIWSLVIEVFRWEWRTDELISSRSIWRYFDDVIRQHTCRCHRSRGYHVRHIHLSQCIISLLFLRFSFTLILIFLAMLFIGTINFVPICSLGAYDRYSFDIRQTKGRRLHPFSYSHMYIKWIERFLLHNAWEEDLSSAEFFFVFLLECFSLWNKNDAIMYFSRYVS